MLYDVLARQRGLLPSVPMPDESLRFLRASHVPDDIVKDLQACCFSDWTPVGPLQLLPMPQVADQNAALVKYGMQDGLIALASGANGDPIVLECRTRRMIFLALDSLYYYPDKAFEDACVTPHLYDDFWKAAVTATNFPWDSYEARRQWTE